MIDRSRRHPLRDGSPIGFDGAASSLKRWKHDPGGKMPPVASRKTKLKTLSDCDRTLGDLPPRSPDCIPSPPESATMRRLTTASRRYRCCGCFRASPVTTFSLCLRHALSRAAAPVFAKRKKPRDTLGRRVNFMGCRCRNARQATPFRSISMMQAGRRFGSRRSGGVNFAAIIGLHQRMRVAINAKRRHLAIPDCE